MFPVIPRDPGSESAPVDYEGWPWPTAMPRWPGYQPRSPRGVLLIVSSGAVLV